VCFRVADLGTQSSVFGSKQQILISWWELPDEPMADGRPFTISRRYTLSSSRKSTLREHLEAWFGRGLPLPTWVSLIFRSCSGRPASLA